MARAVACAVKDILPVTSWRLTGELGPKPLQGWRSLGLGDGHQRSREEQIALRKKQIAESLTLLSSKDVDSPSLSPVEEGQPLNDYLESEREGSFDGDSLRIMSGNNSRRSERSKDSAPDVAHGGGTLSAGEILLAMEDSSRSHSSVSEFKNADSFVSEPEEYESKKDECLESREEKCPTKDESDVAEKEAYHFQIFRCDDVEERKPASILDLVFDGKEGEEYEVKLNLIASNCEFPITNCMRTIDSWTMRPDDKEQLVLYVRETKGNEEAESRWIKLRTAAKGHEAAIDDSLIIVEFLELGMKCGSKLKSAQTYYSKIQRNLGIDKSKIRNVLKKYYTSVVKKFARKGRVPQLRNAPIIKTMEENLILSHGPSVPLCKTLKSGVQKKIAMAIKTVSKRKRVVESNHDNMNESGEQKKMLLAKTDTCKRKRVVVSESEDEDDAGTDEEDLKPLLQRKFKRKKKSRRLGSTAITDDVNRGQEQAPGKGKRVEPTDQGMDPRWRSDKMLEVAEVKEAEVLKENLDVAEKSFKASMGTFKSAEVKTEGPTKTFQSADYTEKSKEAQECPDMTGIYGGENDIPEDFDLMSDDEEEVGDAAFCAICDDGGDLLFCDGPCVRSFHASTKSAEASSESKCRSLGYTAEKVKEMGSWLCPNCVYKRHQCFICGHLGNSEGENKEVFVCDVALCGRFYHPECLGIFTKMDKGDIVTFARSIKDGTESVFCPAHNCLKCGKGEVEGGTDNSMKLAKCRRCPKAYHKSCLPPSIPFEDTEDEPQRAWEVGKRIVIYCTNHIIDEVLNTPKRNHLKWPEEYHKLKRKEQERGAAEKYNLLFRARPQAAKSRDSEREAPVRSSPSMPRPCPKEIQKKPDLKKIISKLAPPARTNKPCASQREQHSLLKSHSSKRPPPAELPMPLSKEDRLERLKEIRKRAASVVTVETVDRRLLHPSCYANFKRNLGRLGDICSIINAAKKAAEKLRFGGSPEDAKAICSRSVFYSLFQTEESLKFYLAPLLHGNRYTTHGRHFTNPDKLKEIIERIHWYIDDGDMVVDFCCGANDFSTLLKEKLDSVGKTCQYKNFDIHTPANTFAFTKLDWFQTNEGTGFAEGKKLVIGLNPPFGSKASLATKFVEHALRFKPKLLVLIVPPETMDGGRKYLPYNYKLVWEDKELLSGRSFYLPGSLAKSDDGHLDQWNNVAPPLFLWAPLEMLERHQRIAVQHNHIRSLPSITDPSRDQHVGMLQADPSKVPAMHQLTSKLHVEIPQVRIGKTPTPSPPGAKETTYWVSSVVPAGIRSISPVSDNGSTVSLSQDEHSTPLSTPRSSSSSQDMLIPAPVSSKYRHVTFNQNLALDGRGPRAGLTGNYAPPTNVREMSDLHHTRNLRGMHGEHSTAAGRRPGLAEGPAHSGMNIEHSGFVDNPATLLNIRLHGNPPGQQRQRSAFGMMQSQQGAPPHPHMPSNSAPLPRYERNPVAPQPTPRPPSPPRHNGMHPRLPVHRNIQPGTAQSRRPPGGLPPLAPGFPQGMHGAYNQIPVHRGHGLQGHPLMHPHLPGGPEYPPFGNSNFPRGRGGEDNFGGLPPPPPRGMHQGVPPNIGSGGWIDD